MAENLEITDINQLWVANLTYLRLEQEFVFPPVELSITVESWLAHPNCTKL